MWCWLLTDLVNVSNVELCLGHHSLTCWNNVDWILADVRVSISKDEAVVEAEPCGVSQVCKDANDVPHGESSRKVQEALDN